MLKQNWILAVVLVFLAGFALGACKPSAMARANFGEPVPLEQTDTPLPPTTEPTSTLPPPPTETALPTASPSPTALPTPLACWSQPGRMEAGSLRSNRLPLPLNYRVYLPPCYDQEPERRYPVLYLIHGQSFTDDQWERLGAIKVRDELVARGELAPFIIVLPRDRQWTQPNEDGFGQALLETLIPWVDTNFRTLPDRQHRAIGGLSRGASWAIHLGLSHWELFGAIGAHSLPVFWTDTGHIRQWLDAIPPDSLPRIYMDIGDKDRLIRSASWFEKLLDEKGIPHEWYMFPGYHEEAYWQAHVEQYLRFYARDW